jgi:hypothetical protein
MFFGQKLTMIAGKCKYKDCSFKEANLRKINFSLNAWVGFEVSFFPPIKALGPRHQ